MQVPYGKFDRSTTIQGAPTVGWKDLNFYRPQNWRENIPQVAHPPTGTSTKWYIPQLASPPTGTSTKWYIPHLASPPTGTSRNWQIPELAHRPTCKSPNWHIPPLAHPQTGTLTNFFCAIENSRLEFRVPQLPVNPTLKGGKFGPISVNRWFFVWEVYVKNYVEKIFVLRRVKLN